MKAGYEGRVKLSYLGLFVWMFGSKEQDRGLGFVKGRNEGGWQGLGLRKEAVQGVLILAEQDKGMDMSIDKEWCGWEQEEDEEKEKEERGFGEKRTRLVCEMRNAGGRMEKKWKGLRKTPRKLKGSRYTSHLNTIGCMMKLNCRQLTGPPPSRLPC